MPKIGAGGTRGGAGSNVKIKGKSGFMGAGKAGKVSRPSAKASALANRVVNRVKRANEGRKYGGQVLSSEAHLKASAALDKNPAYKSAKPGLPWQYMGSTVSKTGKIKGHSWRQRSFGDDSRSNYLYTGPRGEYKGDIYK
jgi:hypothetical protein